MSNWGNFGYPRGAGNFNGLSSFVNPLWTPSAITTAIWLDSSDASSITQSSGIVSQWDDKSGNARNVTNPTPSARPNRNLITQNGLSTITFDGIDDYLLWATPPSIGSNFSVFMVATPSTGTEDYLFQFETSGLVQHAIISQYAAPYEYFISGGGARFVLGNNSTTGFNILNTVLAGTASSGFINGNSSGTGTSSTVFFNARTLGSAANLVNCASYSLAEFIVLSSNPTTLDRQKIEGYLAWKWGLVSGLASDHPYKSAVPRV